MRCDAGGILTLAPIKETMPRLGGLARQLEPVKGDRVSRYCGWGRTSAVTPLESEIHRDDL
jgi:hypothetical protein